MTMHLDEASGPLAIAERDLTMLRGGGMDDERPFLTWAEYDAMIKLGRGQELRKYAMAMRMPGGQRGNIPGVGTVRAMPSDKYLKWYGQGFRPCVGWRNESEHVLVVFPPAPDPKFWLPSMIEEAIFRGDVIPEELAPAGYIGPTMSTKAIRDQLNAERLATAQALADAEAGRDPADIAPPPAIEASEDVPQNMTAPDSGVVNALQEALDASNKRVAGLEREADLNRMTAAEVAVVATERSIETKNVSKADLIGALLVNEGFAVALKPEAPPAN